MLFLDGYEPTVYRENDFRTEHGRLFKFDVKRGKALFLGFSKPRNSIPPSHAGNSYLRFLCLWFIIEVSDEDWDGPSNSDGYDTLNEALDVTDIDASKVISGLEETFLDPDWTSRNRQALYGLFLREKRNDETKVEALKNIAEMYFRFSMGRKNQRSILIDTFTIEFNVFALSHLHPRSKIYETRDMLDAKLWVEGTAHAIRWGRFEPIYNMEETIKEYLGDGTQLWIYQLRLAGDDRNVSPVIQTDSMQPNSRSDRSSPRVSVPFARLKHSSTFFGLRGKARGIQSSS